MVSITTVSVHFYFPLFVHLNSIIYNTESGYDKDKEKAYLFITRGQKVPEELERKLIQREQDRIARERQKQKENEA